MEAIGLKLLPDIINSTHPVIAGLVYAIVVILLVLTISKPILALVREYRNNSVDAAKAGAESVLFEQLRAQLKSNSEAITQLLNERHVWQEKYFKLELEVNRLRHVEQSLETMEKRLADKDLIIQSRDKELLLRDETIFSLTNRVKALEACVKPGVFCEN